MNKINEGNELHLMPHVNILLILTVLSMTKILYSHEFMMEKVFNVNNSLPKCITNLQLQKEKDLKEHQKVYILTK